jgi:hypothetical protein
VRKVGKARSKPDGRWTIASLGRGTMDERRRAEATKCGRWEKRGIGMKCSADVGRFMKLSIDGTARVQREVPGFELLALFSRRLRI